MNLILKYILNLIKIDVFHVPSFKDLTKRYSNVSEYKNNEFNLDIIKSSRNQIWICFKILQKHFNFISSNILNTP